MSSSCQALLRELKACILASECVLQSSHLPSECLKQPELYATLPERCKYLRLATFECKRGMLDMRKRFRGNNYADPPGKTDSSKTSETAESLRSEDPSG